MPDLVIATIDGTVVANSNAERRDSILGTNVSDEEWFQKALQTKDGTEYFVQDISKSKLEDSDSLIYSTALRANGDEQEVIGAMGVLFDFKEKDRSYLMTTCLKIEAAAYLTVGSRSSLTQMVV